MKTKFLYLFLFIWSLTNGQSKITSEEILIKNDSIELPGTLTFTKAKTPLVIWVHGSGNVDRNGNQAGVNIKANYIKQFRDEVNKKDIAFFSFDKRTSNPKNVAFLKGIVFEDFTSDVEKVMAHFKDDNRFSEIILIGHSQGSLIAMLASKNVDKYISLAGISTPLDEFIISEYQKASPTHGVLVKQHFEELNKTGSIKEVNPAFAHLLSKPNLEFMKSWIAYNPSAEIKKLNIPTLIINGTKDLQVKVEDAKTLHKAKTNAKLVIIDNMNHVLKNIEVDADNMKSYYSADYPISSKLITTVVAFIKK